LFLEIAYKALGIRRPSGGLTYAGFERATGFDATIEISEDDSPLSKDDISVNPAGAPMVQLSTRAAPELSRPGLKFWVGEEEVLKLCPSVSHVRRLALVTDGDVVQIDRLDDNVPLAGIEIFQAQLGQRLDNRDQPRLGYQT
jgi:hypothetical protein